MPGSSISGMILVHSSRSGDNAPVRHLHAWYAAKPTARVEGWNVNDLFGDDLPPWDQGHLHAHQISAGPTDLIVRRLDQAKRSRHSLLSWLSPGRRHYLDGLIDGLERALEVRERERARSYGSLDGSGSAP